MHLAGGPRLMGTAVPCRPSMSTDRLVGRCPRPTSLWARAVVKYRAVQALDEHRPPLGQDSSSPPTHGSDPLGTTVPNRPCIGIDRRLGRAPSTPIR